MNWRTVVGLVVVVAVAGALWTVARLGAPTPKDMRAPALDVGPDTLTDAGDDVIEQALRQIPDADSSLIKSRWTEEIGGVDLSALSPDQLELVVRHANARRCTCGCGYTLAACRTYDPTCPKSGPIVEALRDSVLAGRIRDANGLRERPKRSASSGG